MRIKKTGKKTILHFTYLEWLGAGKKIPPMPEGEFPSEKMQYIITETPEDKKDYFSGLGWIVRLAIHKGKGLKKWS